MSASSSDTSLLRHRACRAVTSSLPDAPGARPRRPPGSSTAPCPCQSVTSASSAAVRSALSGPAPAAGGPGAQDAGADARGAARPAAARRERVTGVGRRTAGRRQTELVSGGPGVQGVEVVAQQLRGTGQRLGDPALQDVLEQRQHLVPQPHPLEARIVVVRVVPDRQPERGAGRRRGRRAAHAQQRAQVAAVDRARMPAIERGPEPRPSPSSTVSAWSSRVCPSSTSASEGARRWRPGRRSGRCGPRPRARRRCRRRPGGPRPGRGRARPERGDPRGLRGRAVLQAVVDGDQPGRDAGAGRLERGRRGQGQRVGAAGAGDQHAAGRRPASPAQRATARADRGDDGRGARPARSDPAQAWTRAIQRRGSAISALVGSVCGDVQMALKSSTPMRSTTVRTNADPSTYWRVLASMPEQAAQQAVQRVAALAPAAGEAALDGLLARDDVGDDRVHHVLGVALDQRHEGGDPVEHRALLGGGEHGQQAGAVALAAHDLDELADARRTGAGAARPGRCRRCR